MTPAEKKAAAEIRRTTSIEVLKGILANPSTSTRAISREAAGSGLPQEHYLADTAVKQADALLARLNKEGE